MQFSTVEYMLKLKKVVLKHVKIIILGFILVWYVDAAKSLNKRKQYHIIMFKRYKHVFIFVKLKWDTLNEKSFWIKAEGRYHLIHVYYFYCSKNTNLFMKSWKPLLSHANHGMWKTFTTISKHSYNAAIKNIKKWILCMYFFF